jgi:D-aminopeptidase
VARTGSSGSNGSGDYVVAFSTAEQVRRRITPPGARAPGAAPGPSALRTIQEVSNDDMSPLFQAVIEATEEAIYNSMFMATSVTSRGRTVQAIPLDSVRAILAKYGIAKR